MCTTAIDGTVGGGHLAAKTMPRPGSLDLSDIMEPPMEDEETTANLFK